MTPQNGYTLTVFLLLLWGCATQPPLTFTEAVGIVPNPNPAVPLAAVLRFAANRPVQTTIRVSDGTHEWELEYEESQKPEAGLPVVGMRPDRRHEIRVAIRDADGNEAASASVLEHTTPPLPTEPTEFPPIQVTVKNAGRMEPGITVFSPRRAVVGDLKASASFGMLAAIDADGEVVWYYRTDSRISDLQRLSNGNFMYITQDYRLVEIDLLGNVVSQWYATGRPLGPTDGTPVETLAFHHEVDELPSGNLVILGVENRPIDNYYTSEIDEKAPRKTQNVMGDQIIEFQRNGTETWRWQAFDNLDPLFIGYGNFSGYWVRRGFPDTVDWTHANGLLYDDADGSVPTTSVGRRENRSRDQSDSLDSRRTDGLAQGTPKQAPQTGRRRQFVVSLSACAGSHSQRNPAAFRQWSIQGPSLRSQSAAIGELYACRRVRHRRGEHDRQASVGVETTRRGNRGDVGHGRCGLAARNGQCAGALRRHDFQ